MEEKFVALQNPFDGKWLVIHAPSGILVGDSYPTYEEAMDAARAIDARQ